MPKLRVDFRNRKQLAVIGVIAVSLPLALLFLYWFVLVGFTDPATRLRDDLQREARRTLLSRVPSTFIHQPITQWTRPMENFFVSLERNGAIRIGNDDRPEERYESRVREPAAIAGNFEFRGVGAAIEIELIPAGDRAQVASVRPLD